MANYLLIESRDPFEAADVPHDYDLAADLAKQEGNQVALFLVQNGVLPARKSAYSERLSQLAKDKVEVFADGFSLRERGIDSGSLTDGVQASELDLVIDRMGDGHKTIWF